MGWTQPQAALKLGIPLGTYRNWEQGRQRVALPTLLRARMTCLAEHSSRD